LHVNNNSYVSTVGMRPELKLKTNQIVSRCFWEHTQFITDDRISLLVDRLIASPAPP